MKGNTPQRDVLSSSLWQPCEGGCCSSPSKSHREEVVTASDKRGRKDGTETTATETVSGRGVSKERGTGESKTQEEMQDKKNPCCKGERSVKVEEEVAGAANTQVVKKRTKNWFGNYMFVKETQSREKCLLGQLVRYNEYKLYITMCRC